MLQLCLRRAVMTSSGSLTYRCCLNGCYHQVLECFLYYLVYSFFLFSCILINYFILLFPCQIAKDAKECVQECVSEFISFITSEASERCHQEKRKTINGEDILFAMSTLGFDSYVEPLKLYLQKFREVGIYNSISSFI